MTDEEFIRFVKSYRAWLLNIAERFYNKDPEAIVQEALTQLWIEHEKVVSPRAWAKRVVVNLSINAAKSKDKTNLGLLEIDRDAADVEAQVINRDILSRSLALLPTLTPVQQRAVRAALGGWGTVELAKHLSITPGASKMALLRARKTLKEGVA